MLPKLPRQKIASDVSALILKLVENNDFSKEIFDALGVDDQKLFLRFVDLCNIDIGFEVVKQEDDTFDKEYQSLMSAFKEGNKSNEQLQHLRKHIITGMQTKKIPVQTGLLTLQQLEI